MSDMPANKTLGGWANDATGESVRIVCDHEPFNRLIELYRTRTEKMEQALRMIAAGNEPFFAARIAREALENGE